MCSAAVCWVGLLIHHARARPLGTPGGGKDAVRSHGGAAPMHHDAAFAHNGSQGHSDPVASKDGGAPSPCTRGGRSLVGAPRTDQWIQWQANGSNGWRALRGATRDVLAAVLLSVGLWAAASALLLIT